MRILLSILLFFSFLPLNVHASVGTFLQEVSVSKEYVFLGDIVTFSESNEIVDSLASQRIGKSPKPGESIVINSHTLLKQMASQDMLPAEVRWSGASEVAIKREGVKINGEKVAQIIDQFIKSELKHIADGEIRFIAKSQTIPFTLPAGEVSWDVIPSKANVVSSSRFTIIFKVDDRVKKNISVQGNIEALLPIAVASSQIKRNEPFSNANVTMEIRNIAKVRDPVLNPQQLSGKQATRTIRPGSVIKNSHFESIPLVHRGQPVKILLRSGALQLTTKGIARSDGGFNETIRVQNANSNKIIFCKVTAPGKVEVKL